MRQKLIDSINKIVDETLFLGAEEIADGILRDIPEIETLREENERLRGELEDAAKSLETIANGHYMLGDMQQIRGYANSRALVARRLLNSPTAKDGDR